MNQARRAWLGGVCLGVTRAQPPCPAPSHAPVEAPCSALADDTAEERLCPYTYGSAVLRAGDKQLRVAPGRINLREPRAQRLALSQRLPSGVLREGAGHGGYAWVTPRRTPPSQAPPGLVRRASLLERSQGTKAV